MLKFRFKQMKRLILTISLILTVTSASSAAFVLKEEQWNAMSDEQKNAYVVGAVDMMTASMFLLQTDGTVSPDQKLWNQCLRDSFDDYSTKIVEAVDQKYKELEPTEWVTPSYILLLVVADYCHFDRLKQ